ncbi:MFS transporter [Candidatus Formimonas warabiya]|uniref:MFS transporter n=1 Tax=Formimonas warabiya TaxID=1761012 RepID=A0A3G1KUW0_FORW1|nr:MFS transporter [Candidatus Formimonas warabiya]ATW26200.1 MFS transporter [Candidatus Formimonas warabiya]
MNVALRARLGRTFPALTHKNFRYFWFGQCLSLMGTWMQRTAQQWLVYTITKSAFLLGVLGVAQFGPMLIFSLFAGVFADRYPKKSVLLFTQAALMIQAFILAVLVLSGHIYYWQVLILAAILGLVSTLDMPTRHSFIIELVGRKDLTNALALNSSIVNLARIIGPALAALLMANVGAGFCFFLNGISFIPVLIGLYLIRPQQITIVKRTENMLKSIADGFKYIIRKPVLSCAVLTVLDVGTFAMNTNVLFPVFADQVLHKGVHGYGFLLSAMGIGSLVGALLVATQVRTDPKRRTMFASSLIIAALLIMIFFIHSYFLAVIVIGGIGFFNIIFMNTVNSTLQLNSNDEYRGRTMSFYSLSLGGTTPIGNLFVGGFTQKFGPSVGFLMCGAVTGIFILMIIGRTRWAERKQLTQPMS